VEAIVNQVHGSEDVGFGFEFKVAEQRGEQIHKPPDERFLPLNFSAGDVEGKVVPHKKLEVPGMQVVPGPRHEPVSYFRVVLIWLPNSAEQLKDTRSVETDSVQYGLPTMEVHSCKACFEGTPPVLRAEWDRTISNRHSRVRKVTPELTSASG
jgi:hypothetical protein